MDSGRVIVYTGDGKGKTTAALGLIMRFMGWGLKVSVIQFMKGEGLDCGERRFLKSIGVEVLAVGKGYFNSTEEEQRLDNRKLWLLANKKLQNKACDLVILDEINSIISEDCGISKEELISALKLRPKGQSVVLTGRNAPEELLDLGDIVTVMENKKHCYEKGIPAQKGIEY